MRRRGLLLALSCLPLLLVLSAGLMAGGLVYALPYARPYLLPQVSLLQQVFALGCLVAIAMAIYFPVAFLLGGADTGMIRRNQCQA